MKFTTYVQAVQIEQELSELAAFTRSVPNLPQWTSFFVRVGETDGRSYQVETKMGNATTWIEEEQTERGRRLAICSWFEERRETAYIDLTQQNNSTKVEFQIRLPSEWPQQKVDCQLLQLQEELLTLKRILEHDRELKGS